MAWRPGGEAGKLGNRYEAKWVVRQCARLLREEIRSILPFRRVIMKFVDHLTAHLQTATGLTEGWRFHGLSGVLLRLYEESQAARDSECVGACLDAWDRLFEAGFERVRDLSNELSSYLPQS